MKPPAFASHLGPQRKQWLALGFILLVVGAVAAWLLYRDYELTLARERAALLAHAHVIDENLSQQLVGVNAALDSVRDDMGMPEAVGREAQMARRLQALSDAMPGVRTMLATDAYGRILASSQVEMIGLFIDDRPYFKLAKSQPDRNRLFVSAPFETLQQVASISMVKVLTDPQGKFAGVVTATLEPDYFEVLLRSVLYAPEVRSSLIHGDGQVFIGMPATNRVPGLNVASAGKLLARHLASGLAENLYTGPTVVSSEERMVAFRNCQPVALHMNRPLIATVSRPVSGVLAPWYQQVRLYGLMYVLLALVVLAAAYQLQRQQLALLALRAAAELESREHAQRLDMALMGGDLGLWDLDIRSGTRTVNARAREIVGDGPDDPVDSIAQWADRVHPEDRPMTRALRRAHELGETETLLLDYRVRHRQGHWVWLHSRGKVTERDAAGAAARITGTYMDISERKAVDARAQHAAALLARMSRVSGTGGWDFDLASGRSTWSEEMFRIRQLDPSVEPDQQLMMGAYLPESQTRLAAARAAALADGTPWDMDLQLRTAKGDVIWVRSQGEAVLRQGQIVGLTGTLRNIDAAKQAQLALEVANQKLEQLALSDGLTGIANRRLFDQTLQTEWQRSARAGRPLALLLIDIDHFKLFNDHYGHAGGDQCLKQVAQLLNTCAQRTGDIVCRFGGEEFAILLPDADLDSASQVAQSCLQAVNDARIPHAASPLGAWLSLSVGVASAMADRARFPQSLVERADEALYRAKHQGRARFELHHDAL
jgi:diguanylate cyclase (GGDEF)-like protein